MLSIAPVGQDPSYYTNLASERYYVESGEPPGVWLGELAGRLGLPSKVTAETLHHLLMGLAPDGKTALVRNALHPKRRNGIDLTFSAPKSVSVVWALSGGKTRKQIEAAHQAAINYALNYLRREALITRTGAGGVHHTSPKALLVAAFEQSSSRAGDAQLHTHCVLPNLCLREDGLTGAISQRPLYVHREAAGTLYRAELAHQLGTRLGLRAKNIEKGLFELEGVPEPLLRACSSRRQEIEEALRELGKLDAKTAESVTLNTREKKQELPRLEVFAKTRRIATELGFTRKHLSALFGTAQVASNHLQTAARAIREAVNLITEHESYFPKRELLRRAAQRAPQYGVPASLIEATVTHATQDKEQLIALGYRKGERQFTTAAMLRLEENLLTTANRLISINTHRVSEESLTQTLANYPTISADQRRALEALTTHSNDLTLLPGLPGTGKTFLLNAAREVWEKNGFTVRGAAFAGKAAQGLEEESLIPSATLHRTLYDLERAAQQNRPAPINQSSILVLDEAGMVGSFQMKELLAHIDRAGAKLVLAGDHQQLQPIQAGSPFRALLARLGATARLTRIIRQHEPWARESVKQFLIGDVEEALTPFAERGLVTVSKTRLHAIRDLVTEWAKEGMDYPEENLIFANTRKEKRLLNYRAQRSMLLSGKLNAMAFFDLELGDDAHRQIIRFYQGDRILFTKNSRTLRVKNGHLGTLTHIDGAGESARFTVRLDSGKSVSFAVSQYDDVEHGYCVTTYKGQGLTIKNSYLLVGGFMQDREATVVQASRAKNRTRFFTDEQTAGPDLSELVFEMTRSRQKEIAHDVLQHDEGELRRLLSLKQDL